MRYLLYSLMLLLVATTAHAALTPEQDNRAKALYAALRCVVCEGQSLGESQAEIAVQMRQMVRDKVAAGQSDEEILRFFSERYGDGILMQPPVKASTLPLWLTPPLIVLTGFLIYRRRL